MRERQTEFRPETDLLLFRRSGRCFMSGKPKLHISGGDCGAAQRQEAEHVSALRQIGSKVTGVPLRKDIRVFRLAASGTAIWDLHDRDGIRTGIAAGKP